jgi:hypothetical protein
MAARILSARELKAERQAITERVKATHGMEWLDRLPSAIPRGKALVHNRLPWRTLGIDGFRAFLVEIDDDRWGHRIACDCGWAAGLGTHYRMALEIETH